MKNLLVSFSGGETSAYLAKWLLDNKSKEYNMIFVFANTGDEEERTLKFVNECSVNWGIQIVWVEAVVHKDERKASTHKIVNFKNASRNRKPFIDVIDKYGIPNQNFLHCNREMKLNPIRSYVKSLGWNNYETAIGIRVDEIDRVNKNRKKLKLVYPLVEMKPTTKQEISSWWSKQNFRLNLESYKTNCRTCWKKSDKVLAKIYKDNPEYFNFNKQMESKYGCGKYTFFRNGRSTQELIQDFKKIKENPLDKHTQTEYQTNLFEDSCDIYSICGE
jgi:spore coat polysaccharide biosynthesis predicted glycosyltransferase SpsG